MKRILRSVAIAIVAFAALTTTPRPQEPLPYCTIARNAPSYHGQTIRARARLILGSDQMYVFEDCDPVSALASVVQFGDAEENRMNRNYVEEVLVSGDKDQINQVDAIITGRFDAEFSPGCWGPAFRIAATEVKFVSPITEYKVAGSDSQTRARH